MLTGSDTDPAPVSLAGKFPATLMLLLGGCMFGVPLAIIATGFEDMIAEQAGEDAKENTDIYAQMKQYDALSDAEKQRFCAYIHADRDS